MTTPTRDEAPQRPEWVRVADVAKAFDVSRKTVGTWIQAGRVKAIRTPGGQYRIPQSELDRLLLLDEVA